MARYRKMHKTQAKINTERHLPGYSAKADNSKPFLISISNLENISLDDTKFRSDSIRGKTYNIQYHATLFNSQLKKRGGFYGITYVSMPKPLVLQASSTSLYTVKDEDHIFFHSNFHEKSSVLVVEAVV